MYFFIENENCGDYGGSVSSTRVQCWLNPDGTSEYFDFLNPDSVPDYAVSRTGMTAEQLCQHCQKAHTEYLLTYLEENPELADSLKYWLGEDYFNQAVNG